MAVAAWRDGCVLYGLVMLGSLLGGLGRATCSIAIEELTGPGFPWATLVVNVLGSLAIGAYAGRTEPGGRVFAGPRQRQFVMTGLCGGFTTFSLFGVETIALVRAGDAPAAMAYVALSVILWLAAVWLGYAWSARRQRLG